MPIPPPPQTFICQACGWKKTTLSASDCLMQGVNWYFTCPKCGDAHLTRRPAGRVETMKARLDEFLQHSD